MRAGPREQPPWTDSDATLADGRTANFAGQAKHAFNAALSYEGGGFSGQASLHFRDAYMSSWAAVTRSTCRPATV
jgi:hypothetical protein